MFAHTINTIKRSVVVVLSLALAFVLMEPVVTFSATALETADFTVTQEITGELSLVLGTTTVLMAGAIGGVVGGHATGTNYAVVRSNSGYTLSIQFENSPAMLGNNLGSDSIANYDPATAEPDYSFIASTSAVFAYTVASLPEADLVTSFKDDGGACGGAGEDYTANKCWQGPSTTPYVVVDRETGTGLGSATTTFTFVINVPENPVPSVPADFYTATATLTATAQ